jgi:hypothetical protein
MDQGSVRTLHIDIEENRFGFRTAIYKEGDAILFRYMAAPGQRIPVIPIDLSAYKKKVFTLTREGCEPVTTVILKP